jgi:hypothetical protein
MPFRRMFRIIFALALIILTYDASLASDAKASASNPSARLQGTWLISPIDHDFFIHAGVIRARYLVLDINEFDEFALFLVGIDCKELTRYQNRLTDSKLQKDLEVCKIKDRKHLSNIPNLEEYRVLLSTGKVTLNNNFSIQLSFDGERIFKDFAQLYVEHSFESNTPNLISKYIDQLKAVDLRYQFLDHRLALRSESGQYAQIYLPATWQSIKSTLALISGTFQSRAKTFRCTFGSITKLLEKKEFVDTELSSFLEIYDRSLIVNSEKEGILLEMSASANQSLPIAKRERLEKLDQDEKRLSESLNNHPIATKIRLSGLVKYFDCLELALNSDRSIKN